MFRIDLGKKQTGKTVDGQVKDPLTAFEELVTAKEELDRTSMAIAALQESANIIVSGSETAAAIKDVAGSDVAAVVAKESLKHGLTFIGQESLTEEVVASESASDPFEGVIAANENMLQNIWEKIKDYTLKAWEWIRNLVLRVIDYIKSIFGKDGSTSKELKELLDKLEKEGKVSLEDSEFNEAVRKRLADKMPLVVANASKKLEGTEYVKFIDSIATIFTLTGDKKSKIIESIVMELDKNIFVNDAGNVKTASDIAKAVANIHRIITEASKKSEAGLGEFADKIRGEFGENEDEESIIVTGMDAKKIYGVIVSMSEEANGAMTDIASGKFNDAAKKLEIELKDPNKPEVKEILKIATKAVKSIKLRDFDYTPKAEDYESNIEYIVPVDLSDVKNIVDALAKHEKTAQKLVGSYEKEIEKAKKQVEKMVKEAAKADANKEYANEISAIGGAVINLSTTLAKGVSKGIAGAAVELVRTRIGDVVKESARLYKKP